jgi:hypothetical protein
LRRIPLRCRIPLRRIFLSWRIPLGCRIPLRRIPLSWWIPLGWRIPLRGGRVSGRRIPLRCRVSRRRVPLGWRIALCCRIGCWGLRPNRASNRQRGSKCGRSRKTDHGELSFDLRFIGPSVCHSRIDADQRQTAPLRSGHSPGCRRDDIAYGFADPRWITPRRARADRRSPPRYSRARAAPPRCAGRDPGSGAIRPAPACGSCLSPDRRP